LPGESAQSLQSMARDLASVGQEIGQLKAGIEQLKASQQQMSRDIAKASEAKASEAKAVEVKAPEPNLQPRIAAPLPRPAPAPARKPKPPPPLARRDFRLRLLRKPPRLPCRGKLNRHRKPRRSRRHKSCHRCRGRRCRSPQASGLSPAVVERDEFGLTRRPLR